MQSSLVNKLEKAKVYATERHRMHVDTLSITFHGENADHVVTLEDDAWHCNCDFFEGWDVCSHTMAVEKVLEGMVPQQQFPARASA
jgi:hypothetical protein